MTPIALYEGCYVKTADGDIVGPLQLYAAERLACALMWWSYDGKGIDPSGWYGSPYEDSSLDAIEVYPSLSAASAANPGL